MVPSPCLRFEATFLNDDQAGVLGVAQMIFARLSCLSTARPTRRPTAYVRRVLAADFRRQMNYQTLMDTFPDDSQGSSTFDSLSAHHRQQVLLEV